MKTCTREQAIDDLRQALLDVAGDDHSICYVAKERGLFCRGFAQWKLHELKAQYPQVIRRRKGLTRDQMEDLADRWQVARQFVTDQKLACDVQVGEDKFQTCKGWGEFNDEELADFYREICHEEVELVAAPLPN